MADLPFTYSLVSVGVNHSPGATALRYAARDARDVARVLAGALGPVNPANAAVLLSGSGTPPTREALDRALKREARRRPMFFAFYFGGHGNRTGLALADGHYPFTQLRARLSAIGARGTVVMLNCCEAGGFMRDAVAGLGEARRIPDAWVVQLLSAEPGTRVFMASSASANTFERSDMGGVYAYALQRAMLMPAPGDLSVLGEEFVSDWLVFSRAAAIMRDYGLAPEPGGVFGGFPMVRAHREAVGESTLVALEAVEGFALNVDLSIHDRRFLATHIIATAIDGFGNRFAVKQVVSSPPKSDARVRAHFAIDDLSGGCVDQIVRWGACRITWDVAVLDGEGRLLDRGRCVADYPA